MAADNGDAIPLTDTPRPSPLAKPAGTAVAFTVTFRNVPHRQTVNAKLIVAEEGWVKLKDEQGDVAAFPAGAILSIVRRTAESGRSAEGGR